jgi:CRP-like cAMP-binding protein
MPAKLTRDPNSGLASDKHSREGNLILATLSPADRARLLEIAEEVTLESGSIVCVPERIIERVYFPLTCVLSVLSIMGDRSGVETAVVGNEGMAPMAPFHGVTINAEQIVTQVPGRAMWVRREAFERLVPELTSLAPVLHHFSQAVFTMAAQNSACNRRHSVVQRCARWLLLTHDRVAQDEFALTHLFLAQMLGVRRSSVTIAAETLREAGAIAYTRGRIRVVDRVKLHAASCECYDILRSTYGRLLEGRHIANPLGGLAMSDGRLSLAHSGDQDSDAPEYGEEDFARRRALSELRDRLTLAVERTQQVQAELETGKVSQDHLRQASETLTRALQQLQLAEDELRAHIDALASE